MPVVRLVAMFIAKTFSKLFGLATITFFGRQPSRDDDKVAAVGLASLTWLAILVVVVVPDAAEMLIPGMPEDDTVVRALAIALAVLIPPLIGFVITRLHNRDDGKPRVLAHLVYGYAYAAAIGGLVVALVIVVPVVKASYILRRFQLEHIVVMIEDGTFDEVVDDITDILDKHDIEVRVDSANPAIRWVFGALVWVEGKIFRRGISTHMVVLRGEVDDLGWFEITLHGTDITIIGQRPVSTRLCALLSAELDVRTVYFSWDDHSQEIEDALRDCRFQLEKGEPCDRDHLEELRQRLLTAELSREEWNAVHRQICVVERDSERLRADQALQAGASR